MKKIKKKIIQTLKACILMMAKLIGLKFEIRRGALPEEIPNQK